MTTTEFTADSSAAPENVASTQSGSRTFTQATLLTSGDSSSSTQHIGRGKLSAMLLPELRTLAHQLGVKGTSGMRKGELITAICQQSDQSGSPTTGTRRESPVESPSESVSPRGIGTASSLADSSPTISNQSAPMTGSATTINGTTVAPPTMSSTSSVISVGTGSSTITVPAAGMTSMPSTVNGVTIVPASTPTGTSYTSNDIPAPTHGSRKASRPAAAPSARTGGSSPRSSTRLTSIKSSTPSPDNDTLTSEHANDERPSLTTTSRGATRRAIGSTTLTISEDQSLGDKPSHRASQNTSTSDEDDTRGGRRGRRYRDRRRRERSGETDTELADDDVVQPVAGILDVLDNYAFVRTSGYLAGPSDVYVSMNMVRRNGLRRGDAVTGAVRVPRDGDQSNQRQKFNPLVRLDSVNGGPVDAAKNRVEFSKLTPLYPNQRLRLETTTEKLSTRVIDLIMPIGKGQRALIVSPPKAGKTTIMQDIANAITHNNPECHLMVVLVDERPEEVTDMQRSVKGEVIASTFDRPPSDHTQAAELAIERAKRLVEQGKDVVVLLDSITRLGRAYNNASPASGRILSGGVDSTALYPPKRFLGAARNIENGGSLTIIATAMVETGSTGDTVIFEEFKGTGNAELKLDRRIAERRVFPAVDVNPSGTRKDELLLSPDEFAVVHKLRRVLSGLDAQQAIDLLISQLRKTKNNYEFLLQVSKTAPGIPECE